LLLMLIGAGGLLPGCASKPADPPAAQPSATADPFDAGAKRPPTPQTLYSLAQILASQGRDAECASVLAQSIRQNPKFLPAYCDLAELHLRHGQVQQAMQTLLAALKVAPKDPRLVNNLGMCFILKKDPKAALPLFTRAAALAPAEPRYRANMAMALGLLGRYDESLAVYLQVVNECDAHHNVGVLCRTSGNESRASLQFARSAALASANNPPPAKRPTLPSAQPSPALAPAASVPSSPPPATMPVIHMHVDTSAK
jgi:Flp pilus assembly protein TadD